ncbi:hypothetical protein ACFSM5_10205 [Lacibacterium aquatile]|uniref:Zinc ribbon domain-containing protein n=1 Tax=Lacibacterium aquatile TaxID=1168082 RepID=A0ABW5DVI0_9PROT
MQIPTWQRRKMSAEKRKALELAEQQVPPAQKFASQGYTYLHPFACFSCRKSFKRASQTRAVLPCPNCGGPSIGLTRKFKPPKQSDLRQWAKVEALVRNGFLFWGHLGTYPETLREVEAFSIRNAGFAIRQRHRDLAQFLEIEAAFDEIGRRRSVT